MPTQSAPTNAPVAPQKSSLLKKILIGFVSFIVIVVALAFGLGFGLTAAPTKVAKEFTAQLSAGNISKAYNLTSKEFRKATTQEALEGFVNAYPILKNAPEPSFNDRSVENGNATISGTLVGTDGAKRPINVYLVKEDGEWVVLSLDLEPKKGE